MTSAVYKITITNKEKTLYYIGSSCQYEERSKAHLRCLKGQRHGNSYLQSLYNKGYQLSFSILEEVEPEFLKDIEQTYLDFADWDELVNLSKTTDSPDICKKDYYLISPEGLEYEGENLALFCRNNNLETIRGSLHSVNNSRRECISGWTNSWKNHEKWKNGKYKRNQFQIKKYYLISPDGIEHRGEDLVQFCKDNNLESVSANMCNVNNGKTLYSKGWTNSFENHKKWKEIIESKKVKLLCPYTGNTLIFDYLEEACKNTSTDSGNLRLVLQEEKLHTKGYTINKSLNDFFLKYGICNVNSDPKTIKNINTGEVIVLWNIGVVCKFLGLKGNKLQTLINKNSEWKLINA